MYHLVRFVVWKEGEIQKRTADLLVVIGIEDFEDANPLLVPLPEAVAPLAQCLDVEERDVEREKIVVRTYRYLLTDLF